MRQLVAVVAAVLEGEDNLRIRGNGDEFFRALDAVDIDLVLTAFRQRKEHIELCAYGCYRCAVHKEIAAAKLQLCGDAAEGNIKASARMRTNSRGIYVAFHFKIVVLADDVIYAFVHSADVVAVELDILIVSDNVDGGFVITSGSAVFVRLQVVELLPRNVAEGDNLNFLALHLKDVALTSANLVKVGQGIIHRKVGTISTSEIVLHVFGAGAAVFGCVAGAAAELSITATARDKRAMRFIRILSYLRGKEFRFIVGKYVYVYDFPFRAKLFHLYQEIFLRFGAISFYKFSFICHSIDLSFVFARTSLKVLYLLYTSFERMSIPLKKVLKIFYLFPRRLSCASKKAAQAFSVCLGSCSCGLGCSAFACGSSSSGGFVGSLGSRVLSKFNNPKGSKVKNPPKYKKINEKQRKAGCF